jgi:hypothetical protein
METGIALRGVDKGHPNNPCAHIVEGNHFPDPYLPSRFFPKWICLISKVSHLSYFTKEKDNFSLVKMVCFLFPKNVKMFGAPIKGTVYRLKSVWRKEVTLMTGEPIFLKSGTHTWETQDQSGLHGKTLSHKKKKSCGFQFLAFRKLKIFLN